MDAHCRVCMLGGLRVHQGEREISRFSTERTAAVLAYLAYHLDQPHPREAVAETLWPERAPHAGRDSLNTALSSLRRQLEPPGVPRGTVIQGDRFAVQLNPSAVSTDVQEFKAALLRAREADSTATRRQHLTDAITLYAGELLPHVYDDWVREEQAWLADQYLETALELTTLLENSGQLPRAIEVAREALIRDPLREEAHVELMRLYAASGKPVAALRQYKELRALLAHELNEAPSVATTELARSIHAGIASPAAPPKPPRPRPRRRTPELPSGTVTFLLTDIEGSTALFEQMGEAFQKVLETHDQLLRKEFRQYSAEEICEAGDSFVVPFASATEAVECAIACQKVLAAHRWPRQVGTLRVRMALYTGDVRPTQGDYRDVVLHRASRVLSAAHGGQVLCSEVAAVVLKRDLPQDRQLADLGTYRLRDVAVPEKLFQVNYPEMATRKFPPPRAEAGYAGNLPLELTRFFGREQELQELADLLTGREHRLVTLTGPGGSGKTRLAREAARQVMDEFRGAVWFVPLADLRDAKLIPDAIVEALGLPRSPQAEPLEQLTTVLAEQSPLLILDNLEQLGAEAGPTVLSLLDRIPSATFLATSRRLLDLPGERLYAVAPLPTPATDASLDTVAVCPSVRLLVDRAQEAKPDFQFTPANGAAIAALCERLEGIPLAIELAAARAQVLSPAQMVAQLDHRFDFLVSRRKVTENRHQTLRAAIEWSCDLLEPELRSFFYHLSVFRGGWTLEAAEAVCQEPKALDLLGQLRGGSLIEADDSDLGVRFRMLETLSEYAQEKLAPDERAPLRRRHAEYLARLGESLLTTLAGDRYRWAASEAANLAAALEFTEDADLGAELRMRLWCVGFDTGLWKLSGRSSEGRRHCEWLLENQEDAAPAVRARLLRCAAATAWEEGDYPHMLRLARKAVTVCPQVGAEGDLTTCMVFLGEALNRNGCTTEARGIYGKALTCARLTGRQDLVGFALFWLGHLEREQGDDARALAYYEEAAAVWRRTDYYAVADCLGWLGIMALKRGEYDKARPLLEEGAAKLRAIGRPWEAAWFSLHLGSAALHGGDTTLARGFAEEACGAYRSSGNRHGEAECLHLLAAVARSEGDLAQARRLLEDALALHRAVSAPSTPCCMAALGSLLVTMGDQPEAAKLCREGLEIAAALGDKSATAECLELRAALAVADGEHTRATRVRVAAAGLRSSTGVPVPPSERDAHDAALAAARCALGDAAFNAAFAEGKAMTPGEAVVYALGDDGPDG